MRSLMRLCSKFNKLGKAKVVVFCLPKRQYGFKYLVRLSSEGDWSLVDAKYRFQDLPSCLDFVNSLFR